MADISKIENSTFSNCKKLTNVEYPISVDTIGDYAFYNCVALKNFSVVSGLKHIYSHAFEGSGITTVTYAGMMSNWKKIDIADYNNPIKKAQIICYDGTISATTPTPVRRTSNTSSNTKTASKPTSTVISLSIKSVKVKKSAKKITLKATVLINGKAAPKGAKVKFKFGTVSKIVKVGSGGIAKLTLKKKAIKKALKKTKVGKKVALKVTYGGKTQTKKFKVKK